MLALEIIFWTSLGLIAWTHFGYPLFMGLLALLRPRPVAKAEIEPSVVLVVAAHDEGDVIGRRLENLLALDYPADQVEILVASDASTDRTDELVAAIAERESRVRLVQAPRGGKVAAQNLAVRSSLGEVLAFSDANCVWEPDALRRLVRPFADSEVAYVCGRLRLEPAAGSNREGAYWRFELALRGWESALHSVTGGNGSIYAVRREDYVDVDPRFGHDLAFPYLMVQRGARAVYEPSAVAWEKPTPDIGTEYRRKVRMFEHCWLITLRGRMLRGLPPVYLAEILSHRLLRYASGLLHLALLASSTGLARRGALYRAALAGQLALLAHAAARPGLPRYYALVTWATVEALVNYLRRGVPATWEAAEGTR